MYHSSLQQLINGLQVGSIYALIALGYSMVYGIIMLLNFAHGDIIMVGSYIALLIISAGIHPLLAVLAAVVGCMALACLIEKAAYTPLRQAPRISLLITAIGVSYFLENMAQLIMGANPMAFPNTAVIPSKTYNVGGLNVSLTTIVMGININRTITFTFAVGAALAGIGAILYCCKYPQVKPTTGYLLGLKAFVAAVLGGIGSIPGAMLGGLVIGIAEVVVTALGYSTWTDAVVFAILILVLLVKPTGFMGASMNEKV